MTKLIKSNQVSVLLMLVLAVFLFTATASAAPTYTITDLGTLNGTSSYAYGVNNSGQVAGALWLSSSVSHAFLYSGGIMQDLHTLGGTKSVANGINNSGQVVGWSEITTDSSAYHAFLYSGGALQDLTPSGVLISVAYGINDSGLAAGMSWTGDKGFQAVLFDVTTMQMYNLGNLGGLYSDSEALAINNSGQVVGYSGITGDAGNHAFLYSDGVMLDLYTLGGTNSYAYGINNSAQVVGGSEIAGGTGSHAFLYSGGAMQDLHTLGGTSSGAMAINDSGQVVGWSEFTATQTARHAFLYEGATMFDLNNLIPASSGWVLAEANGINEGGQITGWGTINNAAHAFLLTPVANKSLSLSIDIRPWSHINSINPKSKGKIPVAILSTKDFDAFSQVDHTSLTFGRTGDEKSLAFCNRRPEHVNRDGQKDLVCHFYTQDTGFQCGDTKGTLKGKKVDGTPIEGSDSVRIVPCKKVPCKHDKDHDKD